MENYCEKCGGTKTDIYGNECDCVTQEDMFRSYEFTSRSCDYVPKAYKGLAFSETLITNMMPEEYGKMLSKYMWEIETGKLQCRNLLICSPIKTSKTIWVYTILEKLSLKEIPVAPYLDLYETKKAILSYDKLIEGTQATSESLYSVPYLFIKIPLEINKYIFNTMETIMDRRVRRGGSTIFTYQGIYQALSGVDEYDLLTNLRGDGSLRTIQIEQYSRKFTKDANKS